MSTLRDLALVGGGGLVALAMQPSISVSQGDLAAHAANLAAIAGVMRVDNAGNIQIASKGAIAVLAASTLTLRGNAGVRMEAPVLELKAAATARMEAPVLDLKGTGNARLSGGLTIIGSNKPAPAVNMNTQIVCGLPGARCTISPVGGTVLIGP